jgi:hypothetical protein
VGKSVVLLDSEFTEIARQNAMRMGVLSHTHTERVDLEEFV